MVSGQSYAGRVSEGFSNAVCAVSAPLQSTMSLSALDGLVWKRCDGDADRNVPREHNQGSSSKCFRFEQKLSGPSRTGSVRGTGDPRSARTPTIVASPWSFDEVYESHLAFVWRSVRRLGVPEGMVDDIVQDVFVIAFRRLPEFEGISSVRTWLFSILRRVVRDRKRTHVRTHPPSAIPIDQVMDSSSSPHDSLEKREAVRLVYQLLANLSDDKREVFILADLEEMTAPEIAEATGTNVNTVYARLRSAREDFKLALARWRARHTRRAV